ncbi:tRNA-dihydrouridine(47) synthase [NAD(P)(+)]-like [Tetrabaena socialis]|uniref:tRNA-dihydrouridine(47) synthase [NAD(P)(+)] n=1 Tax=Tetrabaena socialis TaxID=47790 RepID=A0A2J8AEX4_9CHLO|nr:tRNA-dihydrouridine(47) synthase [NAD(P)(+)]-like [Tetrabaena socialis]|eukprot:PNH11073.1 tRNA-dihydrouridine(47) synthase [NAD(P)(+)]-like [Tetrabaena socialis]
MRLVRRAFWAIRANLCPIPGPFRPPGFQSGAQFMDINCGCPIFEATRRGMGSAMLRKPRALARMVAGIAAESELPVTVKIRLGENEKSINVETVVEYLERAGAAAVTIHGRTAVQRYKKAADWGRVGDVARATQLPVIGNGDILTHYEAVARLRESGCTAVMAGRGALIKPWIFQEFKEVRRMRGGERG